jgi:hypothetical protein
MDKHPKGLMLNIATIDPAHETEFNRWYDEEHIPDLKARFPIVSARRFRATAGQELASFGSPVVTLQNAQYLVVYEYDVANEDELNALVSPDNPLRQEVWKLYDDAMGKWATRSRRCFWQVHP